MLMFTVLIGCPRRLFRGVPLKGDPKNCAAVKSLTIQCTALIVVGAPVTKSLIPQSESAGSVQLPAETKGALGFDTIGLHASKKLLSLRVGSHRLGPAPAKRLWIVVYGSPVVNR